MQHVTTNILQTFHWFLSLVELNRSLDELPATVTNSMRDKMLSYVLFRQKQHFQAQMFPLVHFLRAPAQPTCMR